MAKKVTFEDDRGVRYPIYAIRHDGTTWEKKWRPIQKHEGLDGVRDVLSHVSFDTFEKALSGWPDPLIEELRLEPQDCFIKIRDELKRCAHRDNCIDHRPNECGPHLDFPICWMADLDADFETRSLLTRIFEYWDSGRWVCVVPYERKQDTGM